jgi:hypothetical protein
MNDDESESQSQSQTVETSVEAKVGQVGYN